MTAFGAGRFTQSLLDQWKTFRLYSCGSAHCRGFAMMQQQWVDPSSLIVIHETRSKDHQGTESLM